MKYLPLALLLVFAGAGLVRAADNDTTMLLFQPEAAASMDIDLCRWQAKEISTGNVVIDWTQVSATNIPIWGIGPPDGGYVIDLSSLLRSSMGVTVIAECHNPAGWGVQATLDRDFPDDVPPEAPILLE